MKRLFLLSLLGLTACKGEVQLRSAQTADENDPRITAPVNNTNSEEEEEEIISTAEFTISSSDSVAYLTAIAPLLVSRPISVEERAMIQSGGQEEIVEVLRTWSTDPGFAESMRDMMQNKLKASGSFGDIDFERPGNLVRHVVQEELPITEILTANYCIGNDGQDAECDTGAPYTAGLLTTRAFLSGNASRFNLGRAATMMRVFACRIYPMEAELQPRAEKVELIEMFRADTAEEQTVEEAKDAFGNGDGCYTCHGQFGLHAQLFVKFDEQGRWQDVANGTQDPNGELGRSLLGLMTSHMEDPEEKRSESSQIFGERVDNLAGAANVIANSEVFLPCMSRNMLEYGFGVTESEIETIHHVVLDQIRDRIQENTNDPTFGDLMVETFSEPRVIRVLIPDSSEEQQ